MDTLSTSTGQPNSGQHDCRAPGSGAGNLVIPARVPPVVGDRRTMATLWSIWPRQRVHRCFSEGGSLAKSGPTRPTTLTPEFLLHRYDAAPGL